MRRAAALTLLLLIVAGCLGGTARPKAEETPTPTSATLPVYRLLAVTIEYFPIPNANIVVQDPTGTRTGIADEMGFAEFVGLTPGKVPVSASKAGYVTNRTEIEIPGVPEDAAIAISLRKAPHAHLRYYFSTAQGQCSAHRVDPVRHDETCTDLYGNPDTADTLRFVLNETFHSASFNLTWEPGTLQAASTLRFEARVLAGSKPLPFADGSVARSVQGATGLTVSIPHDFVTPEMAGAADSVEVRAFPGKDDAGPYGYKQLFWTYATVVTFVPAPPYDSAA